MHPLFVPVPDISMQTQHKWSPFVKVEDVNREPLDAFAHQKIVRATKTSCKVDGHARQHPPWSMGPSITPIVTRSSDWRLDWWKVPTFSNLPSRALPPST
jgi:hypothetical protein